MDSCRSYFKIFLELIIAFYLCWYALTSLVVALPVDFL